MVVTGMHGIRVAPESKERDRLAFAFMSNEISSERQVETAVRQTAALARQAKEQGKTIVAVAGPVVVHTGGVSGLTKLIRGGWIDAVLSGNALGVHDIESALFGTSLGVAWPMAGRPSTAIAITCAPSMRSITRAAFAARWKRQAEIRRDVRVREEQRAVRAGRAVCATTARCRRPSRI
jgi:hypothetical protein